MSLNWRWDERCGEAVIQQNGKDWTVSLYQGNAFLIFLYEYQEDGQNMYQLYNFWADKQHMKNCLGLNQKTQALVQAFDDLTIELYSEEAER